MPSLCQLHELESQLLWCREWYVLRLWQECDSEKSATDFDRFQITQELLDDSQGRTKYWAALGRSKLTDHLLEKLDDSDPFIRQEVVAALGDSCPKDQAAVAVLIERLRSNEQTPHDRACAAWALGQIGARAAEVVPILMEVIEEMRDQAEGDQLRRYAADGIENLPGDI